MRLLVSWLRDFVDVTEPADALGHLLSMRGFELAAIERADLPGDAGADGGDQVIDVEITANRPDGFSVIGLARELSTAYDRPRRRLSRDAPRADGSSRASLRLASLPVPDPSHHHVREDTAGLDESPVRIVLEDSTRCPRYAAAVAEVTVGPSPAWLAARLAAAGVRPINNVVDVTNYVLLELGQPMHAFDLAKLAGPEIRIRPARGDERLITLDGIERTLRAEMLVIADAARPQAVAGVMGGADAEVDAGTRHIVLESATFDPRSVRMTSRALALKTEASLRFERGADINAPVTGLERALALLEEIGAGHGLGRAADTYPSPRGHRQIPLRRARIGRLLGTSIDDAQVARFLRGLEFELDDDADADADGWTVTVPTFRVDVTREADLIEEVARHYGYDRLPTTFPALQAPPSAPDPRVPRDRQARRVLAAAGFSEAVTFSFIDEAAATAFADGAPLTPIAHPLSEKFSTLRPSLLPGLLSALAHNRHRERRDVQLFEIGRRFSAADGERRTLALVWSGVSRPPHWSEADRDVDFFDVKGVVEAFCQRMGLQPDIVPGARAFLAPGRSASLQAPETLQTGDSVASRPFGALGQLLPALAEAWDLPAQDDVYVAELDLDTLDDLVARARAAHPQAERATPLPRFPSAVRDLSILVADTLPASIVRATIRAAAPDTLAAMREFDRYQGKGIPAGRVSLSLRLTFRSAERTLTDLEVQQAMDAVLAALASAHGATQR